MCGIIGYVGNKEASLILLNGLKKLEVLIGILQQFKEAFTKELEVVKHNKKNKPNV